MASSFLKADRIVATALGLLQRESVLGRLVWRDAAGDFAGAKNDTISIRVPAYAPARSRDLRSGSTRTRDDLTERKVDVTLSKDIYKDVKITDEQLTLDISDFGAQVLAPVTAGIVERIETEIANTMSDATYAKSLAFTYSSGDFWKDVIVPARELLNKARVPMQNRVLALGSGMESAALKTDLFVKVNESGSGSALSEAELGRKAGFQIVSVPGLSPDQAFAFHKTAYVASERAPLVPSGAPWGQSMAFDGYALRMVQILDSDEIVDILAADAFLGTNVVTDEGYFDANGIFWPSEGAVGDAITLAASESDDDIIDTATAHGFVAGDAVVFPSLTGGTGLTANRVYYVIAANLAATTFQVSTEAGGAAVDFSADITAGTVRKNGNALLVRAVKITGS